MHRPRPLVDSRQAASERGSKRENGKKKRKKLEWQWPRRVAYTFFFLEGGTTLNCDQARCQLYLG